MSTKGNPDWLSCPGETLELWFQHAGFPKSIAWSIHNIPMETLVDTLAGKQKLDLGLITKIARMTFIDEYVWLRLEMTYRGALRAGYTHTHE